MSYGLTQITAPDGEPIHLDHAKKHLRVTGTDQDTLIAGAIAAARAECESRTGRQILHARYARSLDEFPNTYTEPRGSWYAKIILPLAPVVSVESITYVDDAGADQTVLAAEYSVQTASTPSYVYPGFEESWPSTRDQPGAVTVTFNAGYASRVVANFGADTLTAAGPVTWAVNNPVRLTNSGGALPAPLVAGTTYYIKTAAAGVYTLAATAGGALIDLTDAGTGTTYIGEVPPELVAWMLLRIGALYENREAAGVVERGSMVTLGFADHLLDSFKVFLP